MLKAQHFYPRPPRGGRPSAFLLFWRVRRFLSTPSARRATLVSRGLLEGKTISIHALREEGDRVQLLDDGVKVISIHALRAEGDPAWSV